MLFHFCFYFNYLSVFTEGYTSISVREPLSNILGEHISIRRQEIIDSHYTTVSDDSGKVYFFEIYVYLYFMS